MIPFPPVMLIAGNEAGIHGWSPIYKSATNITLSGTYGHIATRGSISSGLPAGVRSIQGRSYGKWYAEVQLTVIDQETSSDFGVGVHAGTWGNSDKVGFNADSVGLRGDDNLDVYKNNAAIDNNLFPIDVGDHICIRADLDARTVAFRRNGGSWTPNYSLTAGVTYYVHITLNDVLNEQFRLLTGQSAFSQAVPAGFLPWSS